VAGRIMVINTKLDLILFINEIEGYPEFEYEMVLTVGTYQKSMGRFKLTYAPREEFHTLFKEIENQKQLDILDKEISAIGNLMWENYFPPKLKGIYWNIRDRIRSIRINSSEPWIPWEIIKPSLANGNVDGILSQQYIFSRDYIPDSAEIEEEERKANLQQVKIVIPYDSDLEFARKEVEFIENFGAQKNFDATKATTYRELLHSLETGGFDILHLSGHGQFRSDAPLFSGFDLEKIDQEREERYKFKPMLITSKATTFGKNKPLVVMNLCQSGLQGFFLGGIGGWAESFLKAGASAFIGTLWSVTDETAYKFSQELYQQLSIGTTLGEAIRKTRALYARGKDPSWLAYQLYGNPDQYIKLGSP
jgi:hypothetical protein